MELINLPRLRMKELQTLGENSLDVCRSIEELSPAVEAVDVALDDFKQGMIKDKASGGTKTELDKQRDLLISGFMMDIKAESYFPHEANKKEVVDSLKRIANKYGTKINRLRYNEQTAAVDNMLVEYKEVDTTVLGSNNPGRWIPFIENANNAFKQAGKTYMEENAASSQISSAYDQAPALISALEQLYRLMFAHVQISQGENMTKAYTHIAEMAKKL